MEVDVMRNIDKAEKYIDNVAFSSSSVFIRNIALMKENLDLEWFNIALISETTCPRERVLSLDGWKKVIMATGAGEKEVEEMKMTPEGTITLLRPVLNDQESIVFENTDVCALNGVQFRGIGLENKMVPAVKKMLNELRLKDRIPYLKKGWQDALFTRYLSLYDFYESAGRDSLDFYKNLLILAYGKDLEVKETRVVLDLHEYIFDRVVLYKRIHEVITGFYAFLKNWLIALTLIEEKVADICALENTSMHDLKKVIEGEILHNAA